MISPRRPNILTVFTGGTISSQNAGSAVEISGVPYRLIDAVPADEFHFEAIEPLHTLSENMTPGMLFDLFTGIAAACSKKHYDGLIIAHGTDTLAYTAQLAALLLDSLGIPCVILGSKLPLDDPKSDGQANFVHALELICQLDSGVYVTSRTCDGIDCVHFASKIMQADSQTDDFQSYRGQIAGTMQGGTFIPGPAFQAALAGSALAESFMAGPAEPAPSGEGCAAVPEARSQDRLSRLAALGHLPDKESVLMLDACVGTDYRALNMTRREFDYILQRLYHSGTACTAPGSSPYSLLYLQELCRANGKRLFIAPVEKSRTPYSTTLELLEAGITPVYDRPAEAVWAGLLLCTWLKEKPEELFHSAG